MCGIAGFLVPAGQRAERTVAESMIATLRHRGPDSVGFHVEGPVALAVSRLRVLDLHTGDQPLSNERGTVRAVLNGEIYNHAPLRETLRERGHSFTSRGDTEVIAHAWEEFGSDSMRFLLGMFALAVWHQPTETIWLARDRMGEKPLYYAEIAGTLVFGSELRAVLAHPAVARSFDPRGVARYLSYDFVPDPNTMIRGVSKLAPGELLARHAGETTRVRYWDMAFQPQPKVEAQIWIHRIRRGIEMAVHRCLCADVPVGCFLSGGIDSSAVTATAARQRARIHTFSVGYAEGPDDERRFARLVAERYATRHEELVVSAEDARALTPGVGALMDEPLADMSFIPLHLLSRAARPTVTVALTGDGGDELFAGYPTMAADWWHDRFARQPRSIRRICLSLAQRFPDQMEEFGEFIAALEYPANARNQALLGGLPPPRAAALLSPAMRAALGGFDAYADIETVLESCPSADVRDRLIYRYCKLYLAGQNLANADRASMAVGLELRAPLLDQQLVELTGCIPAQLKFQGFRRLKRLLRDAVADRLPPDILVRRKKGFGVPLGGWLRGPLALTMRGMLEAGRIRAAGVFEPDVVERLVAEHLAGRHDHARILWALLVFESWRMHYLGDGALL